VLGIDPGSHVTGWGVVEHGGRGARHLASGVITARGARSLAARLYQIHVALAAILRDWHPDAVSLERAFVARNVQAAFRLGEVRGAALAAAAAAGLEVHEYAPATVKLAVAGSGAADKEQVARGIGRLLALDAALPRDATDALAVAVCHLHAAPLAAAMRVPARRRRARPPAFPVVAGRRALLRVAPAGTGARSPRRP
jgi:crossover junction endodeoxyribonuclease RuvC